MPIKRTLKKVKGVVCLPVILSLLFILVAGSLSKLHSQQEKDYSIHANIIYHFTKYIDWPANKKSGDFVIGVIGVSPLYGELIANLANKTVGKQKIVIKRFSAREPSFPCHILFIDDEKSSVLKKLAIRTAGYPILLVSEEEGLAQMGSCINFITVSDHLKLEINKNNIEQRGLSIASELLQLGTVIQ